MARVGLSGLILSIWPPWPQIWPEQASGASSQDTKKAKVASCPGTRRKPSLEAPFRLLWALEPPGALFHQIPAQILGSLSLQRSCGFLLQRESAALQAKTLMTYLPFNRNARGSLYFSENAQAPSHRKGWILVGSSSALVPLGRNARWLCQPSAPSCRPHTLAAMPRTPKKQKLQAVLEHVKNLA